MKATKENIRDILGTTAKGIVFTKSSLKNGYSLKGFLPRHALSDLMNHFHCYINKNQELVVITPGRLSVEGRI